jgi:hypothetical protein
MWADMAEADAQRRHAAQVQAEENRRKDEIIRTAMTRLDGTMHCWSGPLPGMGSYRARDAWETAMIRATPPEALGDIVDRLNANPRLMEEATKAEMKRPGTGWSTIAPAIGAVTGLDL